MQNFQSHFCNERAVNQSDSKTAIENCCYATIFITHPLMVVAPSFLEQEILPCLILRLHVLKTADDVSSLVAVSHFLQSRRISNYLNNIKYAWIPRIHPYLEPRPLRAKRGTIFHDTNIKPCLKFKQFYLYLREVFNTDFIFKCLSLALSYITTSS